MRFIPLAFRRVDTRRQYGVAAGALPPGYPTAEENYPLHFHRLHTNYRRVIY